jgi:hypothetical protein
MSNVNGNVLGAVASELTSDTPTEAAGYFIVSLAKGENMN